MQNSVLPPPPGEPVGNSSCIICVSFSGECFLHEYTNRSKNEKIQIIPAWEGMKFIFLIAMSLMIYNIIKVLFIITKSQYHLCGIYIRKRIKISKKIIATY